jgi:hypothetical protein
LWGLGSTIPRKDFLFKWAAPRGALFNAPYGDASFSSLGFVVANPFFPLLFLMILTTANSQGRLFSQQEGADGKVIWNLTNPVITTNNGTIILTIPPSSEGGYLSVGLSAAKPVHTFPYTPTNGFSYNFRGTRGHQHVIGRHLRSRF